MPVDFANTGLITKSENYFAAWIWVACTALIGVTASYLLVDKKASEKVLVQRTPRPAH